MQLPSWGAPALFARARSQRFRPTLVGDALREQLLACTGDPDPFATMYRDVEILAFRVESPLPHWLFSTFGLAPVRSSQPLAGTHTELTIRVPVGRTPLPPDWPAALLAHLVRHIRQRDVSIEQGHYMDLHRPVRQGSQLTGLSFVTDPLLGIVDGPLTLTQFTYAVGLTTADLHAALAWDPLKFTGVLGDVFPLGLSDPDRADVAADAQAADRIIAATKAEGSSIGAASVRLLDAEPGGRIDVDTSGARAILRAMRHRLPFGRSFALVEAAGSAWLLFEPAADPALTPQDQGLRVQTPDTLRNELLATLDASPGKYSFVSAPLTLHVVDTST